MKISQLFIGLVACSAVFSHAAIEGASSNNANIKVGAAANASHPGGAAAVSVQAAGAPYNAFTGFSSLKGLAQAFAAQGTSNTNVTVGTKTFNISHIPVSAMPASHSALGNFNFGQVGTQEVYFGEWWKAGDTPASASHTVYYAGDNTNTTVPTSGTATYTVAGINGSATNLLSGNLTANFGAGTLQGSLTGTGTAVSSLSLNGVAFNPGTAQFAGAASANGSAGVNNTGVVQGHFFGANAAALAGIAQFNNAAYNTVFGGAKN
ncbi:Slam-dependent surface lipoprotein [Acinetobacter genomosp. 15BJ]|uniref:Slam-dependent surface lipoprotein n=1 Tax=Acinetobacter genomosp. 15BJ TaxID=106651 RepID=A0ABT8USZ9_9GAMM|nr:Slam-dependent surface lipoprotein [Acinetobacter genomosp. 15BJ]MDO3656158.1 Slam-dependent surface lipoprotein [Acinetobacter genomosp. 15BJ]